MALKRKSPKRPEQKEHSGPLVPLVDGDIVVFRSGMAGQYTMRDVFSPKDPKKPIISFRYIKELNAWLKKHNKTKEDFNIVDRPILEPLNRILHSTKLMMQAIEEKFDNKPVVYLSGKDNFREDIAIEQPYKGNRWSAEKRGLKKNVDKWGDWLEATKDTHRVPVRPFYEQEIKNYLIKNWNAAIIDGQEADDALGIHQSSANAKYPAEASTIIVSVDKDLKMIQGWHQDLAAMDCDAEFIEPDEANRNFYQQLITGDGVDNIPGIKGMGKVKATKALADCNTEKEMWDAVLEVYADKAPEVTTEVLLQRARLLWIRRFEEEVWNHPN